MVVILTLLEYLPDTLFTSNLYEAYPAVRDRTPGLEFDLVIGQEKRSHGVVFYCDFHYL